MDLTEAQQAAVETEAPDVIVSAAAGTGKTRVLAARVAWLLARGASASDLLVLTFTRKAAAELMARLATVMGDDRQLRGAMIGTFHAMAYRILKIDGDRLGYDTKGLEVLDPSDANLLLEQTCKTLGFAREGVDKKTDKPKLAWLSGLSMKRVRAYIECQYTQGREPEWLKNVKLKEACATIVGGYWSDCKHMNVLDFGLILRQCHRLFRTNPDVLKRWQGRIKHVLVDELQDSDETQYNLHDRFAPPATFFGVGDMRQSIYGFRGARPELMRERHPDAKVYHLTECFRCGDRIVKAANALIAHNDEPMTEPMTWAAGGIGLALTSTGRSHDILKVATSYYAASGCHWSDIAIIARKHDTLKRLAELCKLGGIPYHRVGAGFDVCGTDEFRLLHAALRLCVNPRDDLAFLRLVGTFGLSSADYNNVRSVAAARGVEHYAAFVEVATGWFERSERDANPLWNTIDEYHLHPDPTINLLCTGLTDDFDDINRAGSVDISMATLSQAAEWFVEHCNGETVPDALAWFALRDTQDDLAEGDKLTLITGHAAKGLEWPVVIIANCNEGDFPSAMSIREDPVGGACEERRLFYVALTRAMDRAVLHWRRPCDQSKLRPIKPQSRYVAETEILEKETAHGPVMAEGEVPQGHAEVPENAGATDGETAAVATGPRAGAAE